MGKIIDCTKSITNLFEFHFEIPGHEPDYISLDDTARSLAALNPTVNTEVLRDYFNAKFSWKVPFFLSLVSPYFDECATVLLDFANNADRKIQFDVGSGLLKSANYRQKGLDILTSLADKFLQRDTYQIDPSMFRELMDEKKVSEINGLDELKAKIEIMTE
jgi:hypothetical protein